jgi:hypothetical protein
MATVGFVTPTSFEINQFNGGLNVIKSDRDILDSQAASCLNVYNAEIVGLDSRYGYSKYYSTAISSGIVNALFTYNGYATSTLIYATSGYLLVDAGSGVGATTAFTGIGTGHIRSFEMESNIYMLDGSGYVVYNGTTAQTVTPKIPTYWADTNPDGTGGGQLQELNFLTGGFIQTFNGDGYSTAFYMALGSLVTGDNFVMVNNVTLVSGVGYTVNYASGVFNLATAPTTAIGNVSVQANAAILDPNEILKCTMCVSYGVGNAVNAYLGGNPSQPARLYWSYLLDPSYFPATSYVEVGVKNDRMMGMLGHANSLLIFKYQSIHAWNGVPPNNSLTEIYVGEGLIGTDSLQLANGYPTFFSQRGVCILEKQGLGYVLTLISEDVNGIPNIRNGMITETLAARQASFAFVHEKKYWLWLNSKMWVYEYYLTRQEQGQVVYPWIPWQSVANFADSKMFAMKDEHLYFTGSANFFMFDPLKSDDDGNAIRSYWMGKQFQIGESYDLIKSFDYQYWHLRAYANIATSDLLLTNQVSGYVNGKILTMTPDPATAYIEYDVRHPIHYKAKTIQYSITSNNISAGFSLLGTKIFYDVDRKSIET